MPQIVPAPSRQFKTYSMILAIVIAALDAGVLIVKALTDVHILTPEQLAAINAVLAALIVPAKLIAQQIPATTEQKQDLIAGAAALPVKAGHDDVQVAVTPIDASGASSGPTTILPAFPADDGGDGKK